MTIRRARLRDCCLLYEWRTDVNVRKRCSDTGRFKIQDHVKWFTKSMVSTDRVLLMLDNEHGLTVGHIRFDIEDSTAVVSIVVEPELHSNGYGYDTLRQGIRWLKEQKAGEHIYFKHIDTLEAVIKYDNIVSICLFKKVGFELASTDADKMEDTYRRVL